MKTSCNLSPPFAQFMNKTLYLNTFLGRYRIVIERGFEVLMITLPALLWSAG
jgi:hypothetical protein